MKMNKTKRGFGRYEFKDRNGVTCSLQKSSIATEQAIWLGCNDIGLTTFAPNTGGWKNHTEEDLKNTFNCKEVMANTRMHLTVDQVEELLPILKRFVKTGQIDPQEPNTKTQ